jgi:hypothetical protein
MAGFFAPAAMKPLGANEVKADSGNNRIREVIG